MNKVITICREYGAGGRSIGKRIAQELGIELYDKDIIREAAKQGGYDLSMIEEQEERVGSLDSFLKIISPSSYNDHSDEIFEIEKNVITEIAKKGPCVIVGRCAETFLEEAGVPVFSVFIYADDVHRALRVGEMLDTKDANEIQKKMKKIDKFRHNYYAHYAGKRWDDCHNYDIAVDSGKLGYDVCAKIICEAVKASEE